MTQIKEMLERADFSAETDLKDRLRATLFGSRFTKRRQELSDDDLDLVNAAGIDCRAMKIRRLDEDDDENP